MGYIHYQVIMTNYRNDVQHWKYPPRMGKFEVNDYYWNEKDRIEFYPSAIVYGDAEYEYDDEYYSYPTVAKLMEEDDYGAIVAGWHWWYENKDGHPSINKHTEYATKGFWELPYFTE